jgi:hypothetical protein
MFYHGFDNYMAFAFPEDEIRPISCVPLTRDTNPRNIGLNDVLGNYSLTLIDSLSTLAILASSPEPKEQQKALKRFQEGVAELVYYYGDGTDGPFGKGVRARGFDLDSKVQVFETVIRGVGGLLSAHLFAIGELPITGYRPPPPIISSRPGRPSSKEYHIEWINDFVYDGQLLRLAHDLGRRLLPAFGTNTGLPYPRVNLKYGTPFYVNSTYNAIYGQKCAAPPDGAPEITETCSAGAGSLVLELTVLSRLTGDDRFEMLGKKAFWAVWNRRSSIDLIGAGIDAESGNWVGPITGIGAGVDSFFEYAFKSHVLLSGDKPVNESSYSARANRQIDLDPHRETLTAEENSSGAFLKTWKQAHKAIKRHIYRDNVHPHYVNVHLSTGSTQAYWIDSLSAYYPGLLTLSGEVEEAIRANLVYTALWTRYSALPERWSSRDFGVEGGLGWWPGRPEFIESVYYLYRATKDPWYLHIGEMVLKDIKRRCWADCGWAGLQDVRSGELNDRMESFFLGETSKYMFLLFDEKHPLNSLDAPFVFTTEGHPLLLPKGHRQAPKAKSMRFDQPQYKPEITVINTDVCPVPAALRPLTISVTAARTDLFHAASFAKLHLLPTPETLDQPLIEFNSDHPSFSLTGPHSPTNYTFFPWTLPAELIPDKGTCAPIVSRETFEIQFPSNTALQHIIMPGGLLRVTDGIKIISMDGIKLSLTKDTASRSGGIEDEYRIYGIGTVPLGRDERVHVSKKLIEGMNDPNFMLVREETFVDLVLDLQTDGSEGQKAAARKPQIPPRTASATDIATVTKTDSDLDSTLTGASSSDMKERFTSLLSHFSAILADTVESSSKSLQRLRGDNANGGPDEISQHISNSYTYTSLILLALTSTGIGGTTLPDTDISLESDLDPSTSAPSFSSARFFANLAIPPLPWKTVFVVDDDACQGILPEQSSRENHLIIIRRGGCSFSEKLKGIPSFPPSPTSQPKGLQLVVIVSTTSGSGSTSAIMSSKREAGTSKTEEEREREQLEIEENRLVRPLLDEIQTTPAGLIRRNPIPLVMVEDNTVEGEVWKAFQRVKGVGVRRRWRVEIQGIVVSNLVVH